MDGGLMFGGIRSPTNAKIDTPSRPFFRYACLYDTHLTRDGGAGSGWVVSGSFTDRVAMLDLSLSTGPTMWRPVILVCSSFRLPLAPGFSNARLAWA